MEFHPYLNNVRTIKTLEKAGRNKGLAQFGDGLVNVSYSLAQTMLTKRLTGTKVSRKILSKALQDAGLRRCCKRRANAHDMADAAEALVAYAYFHLDYSIEYMGKLMFVNMEGMDYETSKEQRQTATWGFTVLLQKIKRDFDAQSASPEKTSQDA